ncbi:caspase domain-containing protein [Schizophyllum commune]
MFRVMAPLFRSLRSSLAHQPSVFVVGISHDWLSLGIMLWEPKGSRSKWNAVRKLLRFLCRLYPGFPRSARRRALLIGISYWQKRSKEWRLGGTHSDVECLRNLLIDHYEYRKDDITVMMDKKGVPEDLWPTQENICRELRLFTKDCAQRDRFSHIDAGHAGQKPELLKHTEADGKDEFIIPCDAPDMNGSKCILDNDLYAFLIKPLKPRCRFVAFLDACHSGTLLDLAHDRCLCPDGRFGPIISAVRLVRERMSDILGIPVSTLDLLNATQEHSDDGDKWFLKIPAVSVVERLAHRFRFCQGLCRRVYQPTDPWVVSFLLFLAPPPVADHEAAQICFSACKDEEFAMEVKDISMTKVLVRVLESGAGVYGNLLLEDLLSIAQDKMVSDFQIRRQRYLRKKAAQESKQRDRAFNPNPSAIERLTIPNSTPASVSPSRLMAIPRFLFLGNLRWFAREHPDPKEWPSPAKLQITSNAPRFTKLERFWI